MGYIPATLLPTSSSQGRAARAVNPSDSQLHDHWRAIDQRKQGWERGVENKILDRFAAEREAVVRAIEGGALDTDVVIDGQESEWIKLITAVMRAVIEDFGEQQAAELRSGSPQSTRDFDPWNGEIERWVTEKTAEHVQGIQETTKRAIRAAVLEGLEDGLAIPKIAKVVGLAMSANAKGRSATIARTEVHTAASFGIHESARQSGIVRQKQWITSGDERVRDLHVVNEAAGWIPFDSPYPSGAMFPGDGGPEDSANCRCAEAFQTR